MKALVRISALLISVCPVFTTGWAAQEAHPGAQPPEDIREVIRQRIEWLLFDPEQTIAGVPLLVGEIIAEIYAENEYRPLWASRDRLDRLDDLVAYAVEQGLDPADYPLELVRSRLPPSGLPGDVNQRAEVDILATETAVRVVYQVRFGRVDPGRLFPDWNFDRRLVQDLDPVVVLLDMIGAENPRQALGALVQRGSLYQDTVAALARYRELAAAGGWPAVPTGPTLRRGDEDARVTALRARLAVTGELDGEVASSRFDRALEIAVEDFQARHGLDVDGAVGPATLEALNVPVSARIEQIRFALERQRWVFEDVQSLDGRLVMVNIASAEVSFFEGEDVVWRSRAQIGRPYRQTPVFRDDIEYLVFNPTWTVPPTILKNDVLPPLLADPAGYLAEKNMDLLDRDGRVVPVDAVDWDTVGPESFPYIVRQRPGPWNALGTVKFIFPNPHFVFLHDTPSRDLFERAGRAFSSGCVRVEDPYGLAELLFDAPDVWNRRSFQEVLDTGQIRTIHLETTVPVFLLYLTAEADDDGYVRFFKDVYGRDARLREAMSAPAEFQPIR
jgi:murein L,D-transpeptidase YcbB/YkuD